MSGILDCPPSSPSLSFPCRFPLSYYRSRCLYGFPVGRLRLSRYALDNSFLSVHSTPHQHVTSLYCCSHVRTPCTNIPNPLLEDGRVQRTRCKPVMLTRRAPLLRRRTNHWAHEHGRRSSMRLLITGTAQSCLYRKSKSPRGFNGKSCTARP